MKKTIIFLLVSSLILASSFSGDAKVKFGIKAGVGFSDLSVANETNYKDLSKRYVGWDAGFTLNIPLLLGFAIQPELLYIQSGANFSENALAKNSLDNFIDKTIVNGSLELPIAVQWGIKLGPVRPFVYIAPHIGYAVINFTQVKDPEQKTITLKNVKNENPFMYGIGLGAGLDIWKFQIAFRYKWDLQNFKFNNSVKTITTKDKQSAEVSLAFFF